MAAVAPLPRPQLAESDTGPGQDQPAARAAGLHQGQRLQGQPDLQSGRLRGAAPPHQLSLTARSRTPAPPGRRAGDRHGTSAQDPAGTVEVPRVYRMLVICPSVKRIGYRGDSLVNALAARLEVTVLAH